MRLPLVSLLASGLLWPFVVSALAEPVGARAEAVGFVLGRVQRVAPPPPALELPPDAVESFEVEEPVAGGDGAELESSSPPRKLKKRAVARRAGPASASPQPKHGLRVRADTVLRLANARVMPQGSYVEASGSRPGGMRLAGVSAFGVGLQDGDVLTTVGGASASSRQAVVSAVLAARAKRAPLISAVFWRGDEPWQLLVEMPYLNPRPPTAQPPALVARDVPPGEMRRTTN